MFRKLILSVAVLMMAVSTSLAQPTATNFGVDDTSGNQNTFLEVPVNITNVQNAPVAGIRFFISFDSNIINLTSEGVKRGDLTSTWDAPLFNPVNGGIVIIFEGIGTEIPVGSSGSVIILNFSVIGIPGEKSAMNVSGIELSDLYGNLGTAPAKNGTFTITGGQGPPAITGSISGYKINDTNGNGKWDAGENGISNWTIRLNGIIGKGKDTNVIKNETLTDAAGFYRFDNLPDGKYTVIEELKNGFVPTSPPVKHIEIVHGKISTNNNFTNMPAHSQDNDKRETL